MKSFGAKVRRLWRLARTELLWSWRLHSIGPRSSLGKCGGIQNPGSISIGHHTTVLDDWYLVDIGPHVVQGAPRIRIGSHCNIMHGFQCNASVSVELGDYVLVGPRAFITDSDHVVDPHGERTTLSTEFKSAPVVIENDCWLGVNAVVLKGVRIGHHSIVGANSVVTKDVAPFSIVVGVPAKVIRSVTS